MSRQSNRDYRQPPVHSSMNFLNTDAESQMPLRRSRADTMPTSSGSPNASDVCGNLAVPPQLRNRSGSVTLPSDHGDLHGNYGFYGGSVFGSYDSSSTVDDNASSTVASTLASLGLDDENSPLKPMPPSTTSLSGLSAPSFSLLQEQTLVPTSMAGNGEGLLRNRAYTITGRTPSTADRPDFGLLAPSSMSFSPFSLEAHNSALQRPRAISLGMMDGNPMEQPGATLSHGFGRYDLANSAYQRLNPSLSRLQPQSTGRPEPQWSLRNSRSSGNLVHLDTETYGPGFGRIGSHDQLASLSETMEPQGFYDSQTENSNAAPSLGGSLPESPPSAPAQIPSRALWLGNINPALSVPDLIQLFSGYGPVESARILSDKECAFVNFANVESAIAAKHDLDTRMGNMLGGNPVRVGFGKADVNTAMALTQDAGPNAQGPTRALWIGNIPANMNPVILRTIFQQFGSIESVRVLSHKNCGFVNFEHQEDAVRARKSLQNKEILGPGTGAVRIGFARVPTSQSDDNEETVTTTQQPPVNLDAYQATQWATAMMMTGMMTNSGNQPSNAQPDLSAAIAAERSFIMQQLGYKLPEKEDHCKPLAYKTVTPPLPEPRSERKLEPLRLREMRKRLDSPDISKDQIHAIAAECQDCIVELCSDYIGNTVVQKLFEHCDDDTKEALLTHIAPYLATIGVHKNGTWAAQKIIDHASTPHQIQLIQEHIAPYIPLLLLDQFGNYVVQCCLHMGADHDQFIFDAIVDKCWEIGQGRFGARSVRSTLESPLVTLEQKIYVAAAIVQNAILLTTNANGTLLLVWYLDTFDAPGRFRVLCPRLLPYLGKLCTHKLGSMTVFRVISQEEELDARNLLLKALFNDSHLLEQVLKDMVHGVALVQKIIHLPKLEARKDIVSRVKDCLLHRLHAQHVQGYRKLLNDLENMPQTPGEEALLANMPSTTNSAATPPATDDDNGTPSWMRNPQAIAVMANMYAAAMTAAASTMEPSSEAAEHTVDISQFDKLIQDLMHPQEQQQQQPCISSSDSGISRDQSD